MILSGDVGGGEKRLVDHGALPCRAAVGKKVGSFYLFVRQEQVLSQWVGGPAALLCLGK
jgi:hypothetical protein